MGQATSRSGGEWKKSKKINLSDQGSVKYSLDRFVSEVVISKGYVENMKSSNLKILIGLICIIFAVAAHFYPRDFPQNRNFTIICTALYLASSGILLLISYLKDKNTILLTFPLPGSPEDPGLMISSNLPRFTDAYTLTVSSANPKSAFARRPVQLCKSVTKWFTEDGLLVEGLFWRDVEKLVDDYERALMKTDNA
ncbi:Signal peptidase complex subunit 2 [Zostera marina]|uniref:Signal peptidase complex subunit 2 n=1 Tax=Zostera marina TaxID=29655 RepID=A0A0K9PHS2_ZOSMR|nr:Signal peptidase complex subunit 2 [Zostera marina]